MSVIDNILDPDTFSEYFFYENRLKTFTKKGKFQWPHRNLANLSPVKMAQAGFFFDPDKDNIDSVTCPFCLKGLARWEEGDDPFVEHNKRKEVCYFMRLNKDEKDWTVEDFLHLVAQRRAAVISSIALTALDGAKQALEIMKTRIEGLAEKKKKKTGKKKK